MHKIFFFDVSNTVASSKILIISSTPIKVIFHNSVTVIRMFYVKQKK